MYSPHYRSVLIVSPLLLLLLFLSLYLSSLSQFQIFCCIGGLYILYCTMAVMDLAFGCAQRVVCLEESELERVVTHHLARDTPTIL